MHLRKHLFVIEMNYFLKKSLLTLRYHLRSQNIFTEVYNLIIYSGLGALFGKIPMILIGIGRGSSRQRAS